MTIMQLPTKKTEQNINAPYIMTLYGKPKIGKSTFCADIPDALFISSEPGLNMLSVIRIDVQNFVDFLDVIKLLKEDTKKTYKTIIIDTVTTLSFLCEDYIAKKEGKDTIDDVGFGKGTSKLRKLMYGAINAIIRLGYNVILVAHEEEIKNKDGNSSGVDPYIHKKYKHEILGLSDYIVHMDNGNDYIDGQVVRSVFLYTKDATGTRLVGDRTGKLPEKIASEYSKFEKSLQDALKSTIENKVSK